MFNGGMQTFPYPAFSDSDGIGRYILIMDSWAGRTTDGSRDSFRLAWRILGTRALIMMLMTLRDPARSSA